MDIKTIIYIVLAVLFVLILVVFIKYNKLIKLQNKVKKAKANIDIYLNKRFDLIPNIVECVKSYSKYESETLEGIVSLRNNFKEQTNMSVQEAGKMNDRLNNYLALVEAYPELKANTQYTSLQDELRKVESQLESARHIYNDEVTSYNTAIETVPSNVIASIFAFKKTDLFQIDENKKDNIKVEI